MKLNPETLNKLSVEARAFNGLFIMNKEIYIFHYTDNFKLLLTCDDGKFVVGTFCYKDEETTKLFHSEDKLLELYELYANAENLIDKFAHLSFESIRKLMPYITEIIGVADSDGIKYDINLRNDDYPHSITKANSMDELDFYSELIKYLKINNE